MNDIEKQQLFKHAQTLEDMAINLFSDRPPLHTVYGLLMAASNIIKNTKEKPYKECLFEVVNILFHLEECSGCNNDPMNQKEN